MNPIVASMTATHPAAPFFFLTNLPLAAAKSLLHWAVKPKHRGIRLWETWVIHAFGMLCAYLVYMAILMWVFEVTVDVAWYAFWSGMIPTIVAFPFLGWTFSVALLNSGVIENVPTTEHPPDEPRESRGRKAAGVLISIAILLAIFSTVGLRIQYVELPIAFGINPLIVLGLSLLLIALLSVYLYQTRKKARG
jgi:magnesium-transporting ATPase (P-type)